jgi:hypothetical protein
MDTTETKQLEKEHARWQAEHGHLLKDLTIWHRRHKDARAIVDEIEGSLKNFSDQVEAQRAHIEQHKEVVRMHEDALLWRREHAGIRIPGAPIGRDPVHSLQQEIHNQEKDVHRQLANLHQKIRNDATRLSEVLGLTESNSL